MYVNVTNISQKNPPSKPIFKGSIVETRTYLDTKNQRDSSLLTNKLLLSQKFNCKYKSNE